MAANAAHAMFDVEQGQIMLHVRSDRRSVLAVSLDGRLVDVRWQPQALAMLHRIAWDAAGQVPAHLMVHDLEEGADAPPILSVRFDPSLAVTAAGGGAASWQGIVLGFRTSAVQSRESSLTWSRAYEVVLDPTPAMTALLGAELARHCSESDGNRSFTPLLVWAARYVQPDVAGEAARLGPATLVWPIASLPLTGALTARLAWTGNQIPPANGGAVPSGLEDVLARDARPVVDFIIDLELPVAAFESDLLRSAVGSAVTLAHLSLRRQGIARMLADYRAHRAQDLTYVGRRIEPDQAGVHARASSVWALVSPEIEENGGRAVVRFILEQPGLGDLLILAWEPESGLVLAMNRPDLPNGVANSHDPAARIASERWFLVAGEHLVAVDEGRDTVAAALRLEDAVECARAVSAKTLSKKPLAGLPELVKRAFWQEAKRSPDPTTARAYRAPSAWGNLAAAEAEACQWRALAVTGLSLEGMDEVADAIAFELAVYCGWLEQGQARLIRQKLSSVRPQPSAGMTAPEIWLAALGGDPNGLERLSPVAKAIELREQLSDRRFAQTTS